MSKIAILTNFHNFNPGYSLTGIVSDQIEMLVKYGHKVHLFVSDDFDTKNVPPTLKKCEIHATVPNITLTDYISSEILSAEHKAFVTTYSEQLKEEIKKFDHVFTHDWIFTGWNLPFALTLMEIAEATKHIQFLHWLHSMPTAKRDWWDIKLYGVKNHKIIYPNGTDAIMVALAYKGHLQNVGVIPHIKDLRTWFDFCQDSIDFIDQYPNIMQAEIVQVYPASTDRLFAKRINVLIELFGLFKKKGHSVCLIIANQWATGRSERENIKQYITLASNCGLQVGTEFIFTSEWCDKFKNGLPKRMLRELMLCANMFIYPTREESFGLINPEASLSGAKIMVFNADLPIMNEINANQGLYCSFGSCWKDATINYNLIKEQILNRFYTDSSVQVATMHRRRLNIDTIYKYSYEPILKEWEYARTIRLY